MIATMKNNEIGMLAADENAGSTTKKNNVTTDTSCKHDYINDATSLIERQQQINQSCHVPVRIVILLRPVN